jgi:hypothetical protein
MVMIEKAMQHRKYLEPKGYQMEKGIFVVFGDTRSSLK